MRLRGLYVVTGASLQPPGELTDRVRLAIEGGAALVQYRDKHSPAQSRLEQARALCGLCRDHGVTFLVNDDVQLAHASHADGVHLGKDDMNVPDARRILGQQAVIGVSCYNRWERAEAAASQGADYIAFGSFFPSHTKPGAVAADIDLLHRARRDLPLPVAAIGGISADNGAALISAGADMLAVVQAVFAATDIRQAAKQLASLYH